ncbi:hypothetical protein D9758_000746 [Tetrapyrgos nigripes]|uniref:Uncharacterized protein n=1 Tax=Tetrapyrgos nigripes TaxID=182062 RepID=A0A8H5GYW9_9AGAR|nr:hypothetical protein D9758_000746 [Tetrapyrgos nigripes]
MFEEACLTCGKHIDDGRAFCSDECQQLDASSPCISSASSALSSPHLGFAAGGDVPALVPSALGAAFANYRSRDRHSLSSSSASSTAWSVVTDDDDDDAAYGLGSDSGYSVELGPETSAKSLNGQYTLYPLSYARRPAPTNNSSAIPHLDRRTSSNSFSGHVRGAPRSAPLHYNSSTEDDDSDFGSCSRDQTSPQTAPSDKSTITKSRRSRNRASLPAYFSLLQMNSGSPSIEAQRSSPSLSLTSAETVSVAHTSASRPSPPTPKLAVSSNAIHHHPMQATPRGRKRDLAILRSSCLSDQGSSPSRSRSRSSPEAPPSPGYRSRLESTGSKNSVEQVFDWSALLPRGRTAVRRNSSPPPKMVSSMRAMEEFSSASPGHRKADSTNGRPQARGRARINELDGIGTSAEHPGYGYGRSGLLDRERMQVQRATGRVFH